MSAFRKVLLLILLLGILAGSAAVAVHDYGPARVEDRIVGAVVRRVPYTQKKDTHEAVITVVWAGGQRDFDVRDDEAGRQVGDTVVVHYDPDNDLYSQLEGDGYVGPGGRAALIDLARVLAGLVAASALAGAGAVARRPVVRRADRPYRPRSPSRRPPRGWNLG